jgi:hypothetical protein
VRIELRRSRDCYPALQAVSFKPPSPALLKTLAELEQLRADVDAISGMQNAQDESMRCELVPPPGPSFFGLFDIATGNAIRARLTRQHSD